MAFARPLSRTDRFLAEFGRALQVLGGTAQAARPNPAGPSHADAAVLTPAERRHSGALMRVNHVGEVCAQALYRGQAIFCQDAAVQKTFWRAASEEVDHLVWCRERLHELHSHASYLNPLWYAGSFSLGLLASRAEVGKNLGFMAETEAQVEQHLGRHLKQLPVNDVRSRRIVERMRQDEITHRTTAENAGAQTLSRPARVAMRGMSKIMTSTAYWV